MSGSGGFKIKQEGEKDSEGNRHGLWKFIYLNYGEETGRKEINYNHGLMHGKSKYIKTHFHYPMHHIAEWIENYVNNLMDGERVLITEDPHM
jgi:hypothetical protein